MSILNNARDSIIMGLEDYTASSSDEKRLISCTRNLFAGILLLFKEKLRQLSPPDSEEALIKNRVQPKIDSTGNVQWAGKGNNTVDVQQIQERFKSLDLSFVHWDRVEKIRKFRNDIEHYYDTSPVVTASSLISNTFIVIRDFLFQHLQIDPRDFFGDAPWETLVSVSEVYEKEKKDCVELLKSIDWKSNELCTALLSFDCTACGSGLIAIRGLEAKHDKYENEFYCRGCDASWSFEDIAEDALKEYFSGKSHIDIMDGGDGELLFQCPNCMKDSYISEENRCPICETQVEGKICSRCQNGIPLRELLEDDLVDGFCGYCSYLINKND